MFLFVYTLPRGPIACDAKDPAALVDPLQAIVENGAVFVFRTPVGRALLAYRWEGIRRYFLLHAGLYLALLACFCVNTVYIATESAQATLGDIYSTRSGIARATLAVVGLVLNAWFLYAEALELMQAGLLAYVTDIWNWLNMSGHLMVVALVPLHLTHAAAQIPLAAVAAVVLWFNLLMFSRGFRGTGIFTRIMFEVRIKWGHVCFCDGL